MELFVNFFLKSLMEFSRDAIFTKYMKSLREEKKQLDIWRQQVSLRILPSSMGKEGKKGDEEGDVEGEEDEMTRDDLTERINEEARETLLRYQAKIDSLEERLGNSSKVEGEDEMFEAYFQKACRSHLRQQTKEIRKKQEHDRIDEENKVKGQQMYEMDRKQRSDDRHLESQTRRELDYFLKMDDSVPDYMSRNLNNMSNNRGYVWRGVYYFGTRPLSSYDDPDTTYIQERRKGQNYLIEDTYRNVRRVYLKVSKGEKGDKGELVEEIYTD